MDTKKYTNKSAQVLRFSEGGKDYSVGPGKTFTAPATAFTEGLVARGVTAEVEPTPEVAAGPSTPETKTPATTALPVAEPKKGRS